MVAEVTDAEVVDALAQAAFVVTAALTTAGAAHDLSLTQVRVLGILRDRTARMAELADYLGLERSTLSGLVDRAEGRGLVVRSRPDGDGRAVEVALTERGRALARGVEADLARRLGPAVGALSASERRRLVALLAEVAGS